MALNLDGRNGFSTDEAISLIESNTRFWYDAAQYCENLAQALSDEQRQRELELLAAVYRERAEINTEAIKKMRGAQTPLSDRKQTGIAHSLNS